MLRTLGKALEIFFARTITRIAKERHLLPNQQIEARKKRSTESALETLTDAIHTIFGCGKKHVASLMSLDVSGAFDHVSHPRLIHNLRMKGLPAWVIGWVESFLTDRETSLTLNCKTSEMKPVQTGIPQGSPISPILFLFFNAPLIKDCARMGLKTVIRGFINDISILAYGLTTEGNY